MSLPPVRPTIDRDSQDSLRNSLTVLEDTNTRLKRAETSARRRGFGLWLAAGIVLAETAGLLALGWRCHRLLEERTQVGLQALERARRQNADLVGQLARREQAFACLRREAPWPTPPFLQICGVRAEPGDGVEDIRLPFRADPDPP